MKTVLDASPRSLTSLQKATLRANFDKVGPFYLSKDLHSMIDCNALPQACIASDGHFSCLPNVNHARASFPSSINSASSLYLSGTIRVIREEFFGGICIDSQ